MKVLGGDDDKLTVGLPMDGRLWLAIYEWRAARGAFLVQADNVSDATRLANRAFESITGYVGVKNFGTPLDEILDDIDDDEDQHTGYLIQGPTLWTEQPVVAVPGK